jgi:hypothetical protein
MHVILCHKTHPEARKLVDINCQLGYNIYEDDGGNYFAKTTSETFWRAPDAVCRSVPSGLYRFDETGRVILVSP